MLNYFQKIKKVGCYDEYKFDSKILKPFNAVNILYGNNGSGKTTFSNLLFLSSKHCKDKVLLFKELIDEDSELEVISDSGKITHKNILEKNLDLYVFNSKFVVDHVYNGTTANIDSFSNDVKLTSPEILAIDELLDKGRTRLAKFESWKSLIEFKLDSIFKRYNDDFQKNVSGSRLTGVKPEIDKKKLGDPVLLRMELDSLYKDYANKSKEGTTIDKYNNLKFKLEVIHNIGVDIDSLSTGIANKVSLEAKGRIAKRINEFQSNIEEKGQLAAIGDLNDWFRIGGRLLHFSKGISSHCPLCDNDLTESVDSIISEYGNYFSTSIINLFELLDAGVISLDSFIKNNQLEKNNAAIEAFISIGHLVHGFSITPLNYHEDQKQLLLTALDEILDLVRRKKQDPELELKISEANIDIVKSYVAAIDEFKKAVLEKVDLEISVLHAVTLESIVKKIKAKIAEIVSVELNQASNLIFTSKRRTNSDLAQRIAELRTDVQASVISQEVLRNAEVSKLNAESKYINLYLNSFGIDHFSIDRVKGKSHDNLIITYAKSGRTKNQLNHSLSEGEKTALAFAYFISKLRVEKIESGDNGFENCIVVIDDPISSLDDNRLFQTANLIDSFLFYGIKGEDSVSASVSHYPSQVFILSHNLTFIKYLHNAVRGNAKLKDKVNEYYLSKNDPIIKKLPSGLKNFTNTYIIKLKEIIDFKENKIEYEIAKNYLPNYMRIVLETFLSFKLAIVNDQTDRLPGLSHLINGMIKEFDSIEDYVIDGINKDGAVKRLNHLKKIADHESHGSIYRAEEFSFISEDELKVFAKNTVQVLNFIDNLHFRKIKGHAT